MRKKARKTRKKTSTAPWWWKFIISRARQIMKWSPERRKCLSEAKGFCAGCKVGEHEDLAADHIDPVVPVASPFTGDWNSYFDRMFNGKLQALCKSCHDAKTSSERKLRVQARSLRAKDISSSKE